MEKTRYTAHVAQTHPMIDGPMRCSEWRVGSYRSQIVAAWIAKGVAVFRDILTRPSETSIISWVEEAAPCETEN
jgi:hypothetical protein